MADLVSILIPAYNAERWIRETIRSALDQTWPNKEIIIVNDGSKDGTLAVAKQYESKSVKVITQNNRGACAARNEALRLAQGDYIQWLDSDDLFEHDKIFKQLEHAEPGERSRVLLTSAFGTFYFRPRKARFQPNLLWQDLSPLEWLLAKLGENVWMNPTAWLVSRKLTDLAGQWDERLSSSGDDDGEYICRVVSASERVRFIPEARCYYRIGNVGSLNWSMGESRERLEGLFLSLCLSIEHMRSLEDSEKTRRACLRLLETWFPLYYPEEEQLIQEFQKVAQELGGTLPLPTVSWKYYPIKSVFGMSAAKKVMYNWRKTKLLALKNLDRLLYSMGSRGGNLSKLRPVASCPDT
jgi:glycosyltransferase involved in cell wall biosynthesis